MKPILTVMSEPAIAVTYEMILDLLARLELDK